MPGNMKPPLHAGLVVAGTHSGSGKTTIATGIMRALADRGFRVQAFKTGPDYIDPGWHSIATGNPSHNLDTWMGAPPVAGTIYGTHASNADISVVEGVMGLFDGIMENGYSGSTAELAEVLDLPIVLVVNAASSGFSLLALINGFRNYRPGLSIAGVILNNSSQYHKDVIAPAIEKELGLPVLGCVPHDDGVLIAERHLGLMPVGENGNKETLVARMSDLIGANIDLDRLLDVGRTGRHWPEPLGRTSRKERLVDVAIARDEAFSFHYVDNFHVLEDMGVRIRFFSPLYDSRLPNAHGLILGGGFPEMFLPQMTANTAIHEEIKTAVAGGLPVWAECGGYMYLCESIEDFDGKIWPGLGIAPGRAVMGSHLAGLGYRIAEAAVDSPLGKTGERIRGHEFHYSRIVAGSQEVSPCFHMRRSEGRQTWSDGYARSTVAASYLHIHLRSNPIVTKRFLDACNQYKNGWQG